MSFQQGLSGLNATSKSLEVIGNNIANSGTYGAKSSRAEFSDYYAAALNGSGTANIGIGTRLQTVAQQFTQGSITATDNPLDVAINGAGFFQLSDGASPVKFSRNGQFKIDSSGYIVNNAGLMLMGYAADPQTGSIGGTARPIQLPTRGIEPSTTDQVNMQLNLDSRKPTTGDATTFDVNDASTYNNVTSLTAYDENGKPVALTMYFQRQSSFDAAASTVDTWNIYMTANGKNYADGTDTMTPFMTMDFNRQGSRLDPATLVSGTGVSSATVDPDTGVLSINVAQIVSGPIDDGDGDSSNDITPLPLQGTSPDGGTTYDGLDFHLDMTQFATAFGITDVRQDGFSAGQLVSIGIESDGIVTARYSNGQTKSAAQLEIATFRNLQGLQPLGENLWASTYASGDAVRGRPGDGNLGVLQAGALEESNVDLTAELVNMITAQRAYQANAQTIKTQDQVMQTLVNLR